MDSVDYERLVREHKDRVFSLAFWSLRDREEARDVAQEALVRLWTHRAKVEIPAARSWLLTTAHHLCVDRIRRRVRRPEVDEARLAVPPSDEGPGPHRLAASSETGRAIARALSALGERDRAVVVMREVQEMSYEEIARALDVPLGTLKARLHRARDRLRRELNEAGVAP
jgi:RNA polymerase sigma-70 factor (ECF subfamily)